jgi:hypothetical protein
MNFDSLSFNPRKPDTIRRLGTIDVGALRDAVLALPESYWEEQDAAKPNKFDTLVSTRHIVLRFVRTFFDWSDPYYLPSWDRWRPLLEPVLAAATADYGYARAAFPRIMLARMAPGGEIEAHRDTNPAAKWPHKIHVPIATNPDVTFFVKGEPYHFGVGEAVEVNNMVSHAVKNEGSTDRIHLIFEYYDLDQPEPDWINPLRAEMVRQAI